MGYARRSERNDYGRLPILNPALSIAIVIVLLSVFGQYLSATIGLIVLIALYLPKKLSLLTRFVSAYAMFFTVNILSVLVTSALRLEYSIPILLSVYGVCAGFFAWRQKRNILSEKPLLVKSDILILSLGLAVFIMSVLPFRGSTSQQLAVLSSGEDNASHYALANTISVNKSYTYLLSPEKSGVLVALKNYPQGLHVNYAINSQVLWGNGDLSQTFLLKSYVAQICAYLGLLFIIILLCARQIGLSIIDEKLFVRIIAASAPALIYLLGFGASTYLFMYGFHSQIAAYVFILIALLLVSSKDIGMWSKSLVAAFCGIAVAFIWFFLLPVYVGFILGWAIVNWSSIRKKIVSLQYIMLIVITGLIVIIPFIIQQGGGDGTSVNTPGGVHPLSLVVLFGYACLAILYLFTRRFKQLFDGSPSSLLFILAIVSLIFSALIGVYQLATIHTFAYYFYKSLYILPIICGIFGVCFTFIVVSVAINQKIFRPNGLFITIPIFLTSSYICFVHYPINLARLAPRIDTGLIERVIKNNELVNTPQRTYDLVLAASCTPNEAYFTQRWLGAVLLTDHTSDKARIYHAQLDKTPLLSIIQSYRSNVDKLDLVYRDDCIEPIDLSPSSGLKVLPLSKLKFTL